jgi:DivIVA domain-containing protein
MVNLTPLDIQQQRFRTRFRGFDTQEVDLFLDQMADAFETLLKQDETLKEEFRRLQLEIQGYKNREDAFKRALLNSQRVIEQMKENAQKSAELIVAEAEVWEAEDAAVGDFNSMEDDEDVIDEAIDKELEDEDVMAGAEDEIEAAYVDAAAALLSADLIDEANLDDVAIVIADVWVVEED